MEPKNWLNEQCPLFEMLQLPIEKERDLFMHGEWQFLLYRQDCRICHNILERLANHQNKNAIRTAIVEIPTDSPLIVPIGINKTVDYFGTLKTGPKWFAPSPALLLVRDGIVIKVTTGLKVEKEMFSIN